LLFSNRTDPFLTGPVFERNIWRKQVWPGRSNTAPRAPITALLLQMTSSSGATLLKTITASAPFSELRQIAAAVFACHPRHVSQTQGGSLFTVAISTVLTVTMGGTNDTSAPFEQLVFFHICICNSFFLKEMWINNYGHIK
jgi:hypothetical protein